MPRGARLDAPGTLHHVILRGIERKKIVSDNKDRRNFITRMGNIATETETAIYAWALLNNMPISFFEVGHGGCRRICAAFFPVMLFLITFGIGDMATFFKTGINPLSAKKIRTSGSWSAIFI